MHVFQVNINISPNIFNVLITLYFLKTSTYPFQVVSKTRYESYEVSFDTYY